MSTDTVVGEQPARDMSTRLVPIEDAARRLSRSVWTLKRLYADGDLPVTIIRNRWFVPAGFIDLVFASMRPARAADFAEVAQAWFAANAEPGDGRLMGCTRTHESEACSRPADLAEALPSPPERTYLMDKVTRCPGQRHSPGRSRNATPSVPPRLMEEAVRVFLALGITAADLRLRARPGSAVAELATAMETQPGAS